jgi:rhodanese-related sulfurtransferase
VPQSTVGYEKVFNWAFQTADEAEFVETVLAGQPEPPPYFAQMKRINKAGPAPVPTAPALAGTAESLAAALAAGMPVVDVRPADAYAAGHLPGSRNIPLGHLAACLDELPAGRPVLVHCAGGVRSPIAASLLTGHDGRPVVEMRDGFDGWRAAGLPVER